MDQLISGLRVGTLGREMKLGYRYDPIPRSIRVRYGIGVRTSQIIIMMISFLILRILYQPEYDKIWSRIPNLGLADEFARVDVLYEAKAKYSTSLNDEDSPLRETWIEDSWRETIMMYLYLYLILYGPAEHMMNR
jgi:hypothetical protein